MTSPRHLRALTLCAPLVVFACNGSDFSGGGGAKKAATADDSPKNGDQTKGCPSKGKSKKAALALQDSADACKITSNGQDPTLGVYAVVLTQPAPCDFRLPRVTVSGGILGGILGGGSIQVPVGSYWTGGFAVNGVAHSFPLVAEPEGAPRIDNGFMLVQPDNKTYLLVDAGSARPGASQYQAASDIANQLSQSLGFGATTLLQPDPGSEADNFATATLFKKGSVIAIYDDTPDMAGHIEVELLLTEAKPEPADGSDDQPGAKDDGPGGAETLNQPEGGDKDDPSNSNPNDACG